MAITCNYSWRGITVPNAYIRVENVNGGKRENRPTPQMAGEAIWVGHIGIYASSTEPVPINTLTLIIPWDGEVSPYNLFYAELKAMSEFSGATDC